MSAALRSHWMTLPVAAARYLRNREWRLRRPRAPIPERGPRGDEPEAEALLEALHRDGVSVLPSVLPREGCERLRAEVERLLADHREAVWSDDSGADHRLFGMDRASAAIREFAENAFLGCICDLYMDEGCRTAVTLGARLDAAPGNPGSGNGWHRDAMRRNFKAIVYLSDVGEGDGPFQYVLGSHRLRWYCRDVFAGRLRDRQIRIEPEQVEAIERRFPGRVRSLLGSAGTVILADTSGIHRGMPITEGPRYALTNYYFPIPTLTPQRLAYFQPLIPEPVS